MQILLASLDSMLNTALELDTGRYSPAQSPLILYIFRLIVRVEGFLLFLRDDRNCERTRGLRREERWDAAAGKLLARVQHVLFIVFVASVQPNKRSYFEVKSKAAMKIWCVFLVR